MKRILLASVAVLLMSAPAFAQTTIVAPNTGLAPPAVSVTIAPEARTRIRTYVTEQKVRPVTVRERLTMGAVLPPDVELVAVPADWGPGLASYRYVYTNDHVVLVEPSSRRVIQVID
ncbi:MAG: hypothetical protein QOD74_648 [Variibacter sp.]|jgi:hypothetical protein|nr:hypothetical protein [Variibacter sp.]